ncbi:MAG: hypothetical protein AMXMBFR33_68910 [Candidatus Xenobia bacterium]|jgi:hypothetical protein
MKRFLATFLLLSATAMADIKISDFQVRQGNVPGLREVNIRINVTNPGPVTQQGPIEIILLGRRRGGEWSELQSWTVSRLPSGYQVARDYFSRIEHDYELKAQVLAPNGLSDERVWP